LTTIPKSVIIDVLSYIMDLLCSLAPEMGPVVSLCSEILLSGGRDYVRSETLGGRNYG